MPTSTLITYVTPQILNPDDNGQDVKFLQQRLINRGYSVGPDGADGDFGPNTKEAVIKFQSDNNLQVDASVGPNTWHALGVYANVK